jgi:hypothetical protein
MQTVIVLLLLAGIAFSQVYLPLSYTSSCSFQVQNFNCTPWFYSNKTNVFDSGVSSAVNGYNTLTFAVNIPQGAYMNASFVIKGTSTLGNTDLNMFFDSSMVAQWHLPSVYSSALNIYYYHSNYAWLAGSHTIGVQVRYNAGASSGDHAYLSNVTFAMYNLSCQDVPTGTAGVCGGQGTCTPVSSTSSVGVCVCNPNYYGPGCTSVDTTTTNSPGTVTTTSSPTSWSNTLNLYTGIALLLFSVFILM